MHTYDYSFLKDAIPGNVVGSTDKMNLIYMDLLHIR